MKYIFSTLLLLLTSAILTNCKSHTSIDSYMKELVAEGNFNGNVLVVKNGKTIYENSFGFVNSSKKELLNSAYRFNIGSIYKEFPAVAIMQLKEKGQLSLDDTLQKYLTNLPDWSANISIKNLLQYTSGLPMIPWDTYFSKNLEITEGDIMKELLNVSSLEFEPGSGYIYTNYSPFLLIKIVEKITNKPFNSYAQENLFTPYDLKSLVIKEQFPYVDNNLMAIPFNTENVEDSYKIKVSSLLFNATTQDLYNWLKNLHNFKIITKKSLQILSEEYNTSGNIQAPLGYCEWKNNEVVEHSHHGSSASYEGIVRYFKNEDLFIIILTNQKHRNVRDISDNIRKIINQ